MATGKESAAGLSLGRLGNGVYGRLAMRRWIRVAGPDAATHLHAMLTRELLTLADGRVRYAALVDDRAHYLADCWVLRPGGDWWLDAADTVADRLRERLELFAVASEVQLTDASATHDLFHFEGENAGRLAATLGLDDALEHGEAGRAGVSRLFEFPFLWAERSLFGEPGVSCLVRRTASEHFFSELDSAASALWMVELGPYHDDRWRIEAGRPQGGVDLLEEHLLPETGLWRAVSLDKGCFPGQEILQRVHRQGHLKRRLTGVAGDGVWGPGGSSGIMLLNPNGEPAGSVTSWVPSATGQATIGLAWVRQRADDAGDGWQVSGPEGPLPCRLVELPFVPLGVGRLVDSPQPEWAPESAPEG